jgi:uncharacterized protein (TIGR00369 family)
MKMVGSGQSQGEPRHYGVIPVEMMKQFPGLEVLRRLIADHGPYPLMSEVIPFELVEVESGRAVMRAVPDRRFNNTAGISHGGYAMTLLDSVMGLAIFSRLASGIGYTTIETKVNFTRPITESTGPVSAVGNAIHIGKRSATSEGQIVDESGRICAHGTTTCFLFPLEGDGDR